MKRSLSDIMMKDFISLLCGDTGVLLEEGDREDPAAFRKCSSDMIYEYRRIVNPGGTEAAMLDLEDKAKARIRLLISGMLHTMYALGSVSDVKELLTDYLGYSRVSEEDIPNIINRMRLESEYLLKRYADDTDTGRKMDAKEIRASYDSEVAALMTFFKMQINLELIPAGVYANLLRQADMQIRKMKNVRK